MKIDFLSKRIVLSSKELAQASNYGSEMYVMLQHARMDLPEFMIEVKPSKPTFNPNAGLTYEFMTAYIAEYAEDEMQMFSCYRSAKGYFKTAVWFRNRFPNAIAPHRYYNNLQAA